MNLPSSATHPSLFEWLGIRPFNTLIKGSNPIHTTFKGTGRDLLIEVLLYGCTCFYIWLFICFLVLMYFICFIFFLFALIKNSFIYSKRRTVIVFFFGILLLVFPAYVFCQFCAPVSLHSGLKFCIHSWLLWCQCTETWFFVSLFYTLFFFFFFFFGCSSFGLSLPLSPLQVGIPCCLLLYSI